MTAVLKTAGIILAGGLATRMQQQDKGLVTYKGQPLVQYAIQALQPVATSIFISANRNLAQYQQFGLPVLEDTIHGFQGPLAGVLSALHYCQADILAVIPCDCPLLQSQHVQALLQALHQHQADIAVAFDGSRLHPVCFACRTQLKDSLNDYLASGQRKIANWQALHQPWQVDFSKQPHIFTNLNTLADLAALEQQ
jgi:molybdenum cofactor guanylyltransferase